MTARAADLAERMRASAVHARPTPQTVAVSAVEPPPHRPQQLPPARFTVELDRAQHRFVKRFALEADTDASTVTRCLLSLLESDAALAERVREAVAS